MKTLKKIGSVLLDILIVLIFAVSVFVIIANISAQKDGGRANVFGYVISSVQTDSMSGTIEAGDLIIGKIPDADTTIQKDDIISFNSQVGKNVIEITHRVIDVQYVGDTPWYTTQGDNREVCPIPDADDKTLSDVNSVYKFRIPFAGKFIDFLKTPLGFVICLVLPMVAFIAYQVYKLIAIYLKTKQEAMIQEVTDSVSDEAKDAIIKEYLAKMQSAEAEKEKSEESSNDDNSGENN